MKSADLSENVEYFKEKSSGKRAWHLSGFEFNWWVPEVSVTIRRLAASFRTSGPRRLFSNWRGQPIKIVQGICTQAIITMIFELFERNKKKKTIIFWLEKIELRNLKKIGEMRCAVHCTKVEHWNVKTNHVTDFC